MGLTQAERDAVARWAAETELLTKYMKALSVIEEFLGDCAASGVNPAIVWPMVSTETKRYKAIVTIVPLGEGVDGE